MRHAAVALLALLSACADPALPPAPERPNPRTMARTNFDDVATIIVNGRRSDAEPTPPPDPSFPPIITGLSDTSGEVGDTITITGSRFSDVTSVRFNGVEASFTIVDDGVIAATVPNGAQTGSIAVTNPDGTGTSSSFTIIANSFAFDLTGTTVPEGITVTRTGGNAIAQRGLASAALVTTPAIAEDWGDGNGSGIWTFQGYQNPAPPNDFTDAAWDLISTPTVTANDAVAPDGTTTADKVADTSGAAAQGLWLAGSQAPGDDRWSVASVWVKNATPAPSSQGVIGALAGSDTIYYSKSLSSAADWRRVWSAWRKPFATGGYEYIGILPAGAAPNADNINTDLTPSATGAVHLWGASASRGYGLLPCIIGTTGDATITAEDPAEVLAPNGDLHIEGEFLMDPVSSGGPLEADGWYFFKIVASNGDYSISYGQQLVVNGTFRGVPAGTTGASRNVGALSQNKGFRWEFWYRPSTNDYGMQFWVNGMRESNATFRNVTTAAIGTVTAAYLGHNNGSNILPRRHTLWRKTTRSLDAAKIVMLGDSIVSTYSALASAATFLYTAAEARTLDGIVSYASPGQTVAQQLTAWQASAQRGASDVGYIWIHAAINDLNTETAATTTARLQSLINDINTNNPNAKIVLDQVFPCRAGVGDTQWAKAEVVNSNIVGTGPNPITGNNILVVPYWTEADDGTGNLIAAYDNGDGLHENELGRMYLAGKVRDVIVADGGL